MPVINPYLTFQGTCEEAFNFYKSVFGGEFSYIGRFADMPSEGDKQMPAEQGNKIMHVSLPISKETVLMGSDTGGEWAEQIQVGNNITISINADTKEQADKFYNALSASGKATMPMNQTFWGDYFGMCTDKFDVNWMISFNEQTKPQ